MTEIVLLRHGETKWDRQNRLHGHAPVQLTDSGRESVETIGRELASNCEFDQLAVAETLAARTTAEIVRLAGVEPRACIDSAWKPRDAGVFQGLAYEQFEIGDETDSEFSRTDADILPPLPQGGESLAAGRQRVLDGWRQLCETAAETDTILVVTHDFPIATILASIAGADPVNELGEYAPASCSAMTIRYRQEEVTETETERGKQFESAAAKIPR